MTNGHHARRVSLPRLAAGVLLHVSVPAYLVACLAACLMPPVSEWVAVPGRMLWTGAWFLPLFASAMLLTVLIARVVEPRTPTVPDAAGEARAALGGAAKTLARLGDRRLERLALEVEAIGWDWADARDRQVVADLATAAHTFAAAAATAQPGRRAEVLTLTADSIERLAAAGRALAAARGALDEGDARTVAGYLAARYGD